MRSILWVCECDVTGDLTENPFPGVVRTETRLETKAAERGIRNSTQQCTKTCIVDLPDGCRSARLA